jgi:hypothetical protein
MSINMLSCCIHDLGINAEALINIDWVSRLMKNVAFR